MNICVLLRLLGMIVVGTAKPQLQTKQTHACAKVWQLQPAITDKHEVAIVKYYFLLSNTFGTNCPTKLTFCQQVSSPPAPVVTPLLMS